MQFGKFELQAVSGGRFRIDGGTMFGVVPRVLWSRQCSPDDRHTIPQETRCLLLRSDSQTVLIDTGYGSKLSEKERKIFVAEEGDPLLRNLQKIGVAAEDVDLVILSHLHFDHAGGATRFTEDGELVPTFPNAEYVVQRLEWATATADFPELRGVYSQHNLQPLLAANQLRLLDGDVEIIPGISARVTGGHTNGHSAILIEGENNIDGENNIAVFLGDLCPTAHHLPIFWGMSYDVDMLQLRRMKSKLLGWLAHQKGIAIFDHDPETAAARLTHNDKGHVIIAERVEL